MKNPAAIGKPKLQSPISGKRKNGKGNLPYLRTRRRLRKDILRGMW